jgi:hypothetical protein
VLRGVIARGWESLEIKENAQILCCQRDKGFHFRLPVDDLPVLVVDELEALGQQPYAGHDSSHNARERGRANHVDEQAIAYLVSFVG